MRTPTILLACLALALTACGDGSAGDGAGGGSGSGGGGASSGGGSGGSGGTAGTGGAAGTGGTAGTGGAFGDPIVATAEQWTWVDFPDSSCANGTATGIGVNPGTGTDVLIYLEGGGACWDQLTCYTLQTATNITSGYDSAAFTAMEPNLHGSIFNRSDASNPFADASYYYVPYCTGDVHAGNAVNDYGGITTTHAGYANIGAFLRRIVPTHPSATRVYLSGSSAGGYGAAANWLRTQEAFGSIPVDAIDDSGPWLPNPILSESLEQAWRTAWGLDANLPAGCTACLDDLGAIVPYVAAQLPNDRFGLLSFTEDTVIPSYFQINATSFATGLEDIRTSLSALPNAEVMYITGQGHVTLGDWTNLSEGGVTVRDWVTALATGDVTWTEVVP